MLVSRTAELRALHAERRQHGGGTLSNAAGKGASPAAAAPPLFDKPLSVVTGAADGAIRGAGGALLLAASAVDDPLCHGLVLRRKFRAAVAVADRRPPSRVSAMDALAALAEADAQLGSVGSALSNLSAAIGRTAAQMVCDLTAPASLWTPLVAADSGDGSTTNSSGNPLARLARGRASGAAAECQQFQLLHAAVALQALGQRIAAAKVGVATMRQDLERHRMLHARFARSGVLANPYDDIADAAPAAASLLITRPLPARATATAAAGGVDQTAAESARHAATAVGRGVAGVVGRLAQRTATTLDAVAQRAADAASATTTTVLGGVRGALPDAGVAGGTSVSAIQNPVTAAAVMERRAARHRWSHAGERADDAANADRLHTALREERTQLLVQQRESSVAAARAVEVSIRELGAMTAMLSDVVAAQADQLAEVQRNAAEGAANFQRASAEVKKSEDSFWSLKRIIIVIIWTNIGVLLFAHYVIR